MKSDLTQITVPGTHESQDAVMLASVPSTTTVVICNPVPAQVIYSGAPKYVVIQGTTVQYAVNTPKELRGAIEGENTTVWTDDWSGYLPLARHRVKHRSQIQGTPERAATILPWAHVVASNLKAWLLGTFRGVSPKHLQRYLDEFTYRFTRRGIADKLFFYAARRAVEGEPLTYHRLTAESVG